MDGVICASVVAAVMAIGSPLIAQNEQIPFEYLEEFAGALPDGSFRFGLRVSEKIPADLRSDVFEPGWVIVELHQTEPDLVITEGPHHILDVLDQLEAGAVATLSMINPQSGDVREERLVVRSDVELAADRQLETASNPELFGTTLYGRRLELMARGHFEALDSLRARDVRQGLDELGPMGALLETFAPSIGDNLARTSRYEGLVVMFAVARVTMHGSCGDRLVSYSVSQTTWTEFRNGLGHYRGSTAPATRTVGSFLIPAAFAPIVERMNYTETPREIGAVLGPIVQRLPCDNALRQQLEENMLRYVSDLPAAHVMK